MKNAARMSLLRHWEPERRINNNIVLKKLRIAFSLKTDDILAILTEQQFRVSMPEITAMMRAPDHKNFRECGDQFLRYFLRGLAARQHVKKSLRRVWRPCETWPPTDYFTSLKPAAFITSSILRHSDTFFGIFSRNVDS
ncbi:conserved protein, DUF1456 family [Escherichia coli]|uniref:Conserved protein, DUF1456 family n=2 Tax=Escherichia coli TaxID=562 RepID=A0A377DQ33_ECOLX|nr:conserved protein, DUF1456 family [Escherichia coli]